MKGYNNSKKQCLCIIMAVVMAAVLMLGGCSSDNKSDKASAADNNAEVKETEAPTAGEATPEPSAEETAEVTPEAEASVATIPMATDWSVVVDTKITHATNISGFLNENFGVTVGYGGEIHYTEDGGKTWPQSFNGSACRFSLDIVDENLMWCGGNGNNVRYSEDGAESFKAVSDVNLGGMHSSIDFIDDTTGWIAASKKMAATKDGGDTWTELTYPAEVKGIAALQLRTPEEGYLLSNNGLFYITKDGGASWSLLQDLNFAQYGIVADVKGTIGLAKINQSQADISFTDENNGIIVFTGTIPGEGNLTVFLTTTDGGETWDVERFEPIEGFAPAKVFLSGDGKYLTLGTSDNHTMVFKHND